MENPIFSKLGIDNIAVDAKLIKSYLFIKLQRMRTVLITSVFKKCRFKMNY